MRLAVAPVTITRAAAGRSRDCHQLQRRLIFGGTWGPSCVQALLAFCLIVVAPFAEELFFRGLALRAFESRFSSRAAVVCSAVLFATIHLQVLQFPALLLFGLILGALASRNGRLGENICAHAAFNATTVVILATSS